MVDVTTSSQLALANLQDKVKDHYKGMAGLPFQKGKKLNGVIDRPEFSLKSFERYHFGQGIILNRETSQRKPLLLRIL